MLLIVIFYYYFLQPADLEFQCCEQLVNLLLFSLRAIFTCF